MQWYSKRSVIALLVIPSLLLYTLYMIIPVIVTVYYSLTVYNGLGVPKWAGLKNYTSLLADRYFLISLKNTLIVFSMAVLLLIPLSFFLALLLNRSFRGSGFAKAMSFSPNIISPVLIGLMWVFILDPTTGLINSGLRALGLEHLCQVWIGGQTLTPFSVGLVFIWQKLGFHATVFLAGLKTVPNELYEACAIDGANGWQQLRYVTLPAISQTVLINLVLAITASFKVFEIVLQLTNGGPGHVSELLVTYMYSTTFISARFGYGMSIAIVGFVLSVLLSFGIKRPIERTVEAS